MDEYAKFPFDQKSAGRMSEEKNGAYPAEQNNRQANNRRLRGQPSNVLLPFSRSVRAAGLDLQEGGRWQHLRLPKL
ncbi:hypothetical protein D3C87_1951310 [compost metagenome]